VTSPFRHSKIYDGPMVESGNLLKPREHLAQCSDVLKIVFPNKPKARSLLERKFQRLFFLKVVAVGKKLVVMQWRHSAAWTAWCSVNDTDTVEGFEYLDVSIQPIFLTNIYYRP